MSSASASSSAAAAAALSVQTGALSLHHVDALAQAASVSRVAIITAAINILHFRYTGITECDVRLRLSGVGAASSASSAAAAPAGSADLSCVVKRGMTLRDAFTSASNTLVAALPAAGASLNPATALTCDSIADSSVEFHQLMSAELQSSGFQHIVHVTVTYVAGAEPAVAATTAGGGGKKKKKAAAADSDAASLSARYEFPPMATPGQADPRLRVSQHLACLLDNLASLVSKDGLDQPLHIVQFLPPAERHNLISVWSGLPEYDKVDRTDQLLQELFEETAARFPDRIAIECSAPVFRQMTYKAMSRRTNQLAHWMRNNGVGVGSYVGMWLPRGMEVYIALIAILKAGASYVPIDPEYPSDRVSFICEDCKAPVLITHSELLKEHADFVLPAGCQTIQYDQVDALLEAQDDSMLTREITGQKNSDGCYVIYTSGSTGRPKGCQLEHRSAVNLVRAERILFGVHENDKVYQGFSIAFDASVEEVWLAFASGATLVAATPDMLHAGPALPGMLVAQGITVVSTVPTLLSMMEDTLPQVRILISGGEAVQKDIIKRWSKGRRFINTYGPTEATVIATHIDTDPSAPLVTIGRAVPSYFLYILDADLNPCPVGVAGELHIGGMCVARGYLNRDDLTKEKFIPFPVNKLWGDHPGEEALALMQQRSPRLYKAGDLTRWTEDGEVEFCGRIDAQVKLRGYRVELSEIESVLMMQENIQSAVVSVREDVPGIQNLCGYVILRDPSLPFDQDVLKESIRVRLPAYMTPACIDVLTKFPTLPSGKVNRKELPAPKNLVVINYDEIDEEEASAGGAAAAGSGDAAASSTSAAASSSSAAATKSKPDEPVDPNYFPPRSPLEKRLASMWRKLFQRPKISTTDDFFTLGGHSLLAAWLVSALRKDAATEGVTMADVYGHPILRDLACKLSGGDPAELPSPEEEAAAHAAYATSGAAGGAGAPGAAGGADEKDNEASGDGGGDDGMPSLPGGSNGGGRKSSIAGGLDPSKPHPLASYAPFSNLNFILCGLAQLLVLYFLFALPALQIGVPWSIYLKVRSSGWQYIIIMLLPFSVAVFPLYVGVTLVAKWVLIGQYKEGRHPLWGSYYFRWWIVQRLTHYIPLVYLRGSPVLCSYFRWMGADIGRNVFLGSHLIEAPDLVSIGEGASVGIDAQLSNFHVEGNWLYIRRIVIGRGCYVGARSVVSGGSVMHPNSQLGAMSLLTQGMSIPSWEHWRGSPAMRTARVDTFIPVFSEDEKFSARLRKRQMASGGAGGHVGLNQRGMLNSRADEEPAYIPLNRAIEDGGVGWESENEDSEISGRRGSSAAVTTKTKRFLESSLSDLLLPQDSMDVEAMAARHARPSTLSRFMLGLGQSAVLTVLLPCMILLAIAPGMYFLHYLMPTDVSVINARYQTSDSLKFLAAAAPLAFSFTAILAWEIVVVKWVLIGQIQPGDYRIHSWFYLRKWTVDVLMQLSIQVLHPLYSTQMLVPWFRILGAVIGDRCEIATAVYAAPDLIEMGDECFVADTVYLGLPAVHQGTIRLAKISLGNRVFVGNGACLPMQTVIGSECLVGVMSAPPLAHALGSDSARVTWPEPALRAEEGTAWLGNPAMFLPNRQPPAGSFDSSVLYRPHVFLRLGRGIFELFKVTLPLMLFVLMMLLILGDFHLLRVHVGSWVEFWLLWPLLYMAAGVCCCFITILAKWILIGKYIAGEHALWSSFIWRHDLVTALLDSLVHPYFISLLRGTPFVSMWFRLLGAEIGSRVWLDSHAITEPDLVHVGDDAAIASDAQLQTHLFEDRILKMSHLNVGKKCSVGTSAVVLYDSTMGEGSTLLPLSLLMKAESLPPWTSWQGVPAHQTHSIGAQAPVHMAQVIVQEVKDEEARMEQDEQDA